MHNNYNNKKGQLNFFFNKKIIKKKIIKILYSEKQSSLLIKNAKVAINLSTHHKTRRKLDHHYVYFIYNILISNVSFKSFKFPN